MTVGIIILDFAQVYLQVNNVINNINFDLYSDGKHSGLVQVMVFERGNVNMKNNAWSLYSKELTIYQRKNTCSKGFRCLGDKQRG